MREADEVAKDGTIEGAVNIPLGQLIRKARQGGLEALEGKTVCTYCNGGYGATTVLMNLQERIYRLTIDGGYAAWKEEEKK